jgi:hypothetical protein
MKLPKSVYTSYSLLKRSRVVLKKDTDCEALQYFQSILNEAQPSTTEDMALYKFVKGMYNENKYKFLSFISNTSYECLVLWTESKTIINTLRLRGVVYIKWSSDTLAYTVSEFISPERREVTGSTQQDPAVPRESQEDKSSAPVDETTKPSRSVRHPDRHLDRIPSRNRPSSSRNDWVPTSPANPQEVDESAQAWLKPTTTVTGNWGDEE